MTREDENQLRPIPIPKTSEEARLLLQQRLALMGQIACLGTIGLWIMQTGMALPPGGLDRMSLANPSIMAFLGAIAITASLWFGGTRGNLDPRSLLILDAIALPVTAAVLAFATLHVPEARQDVRAAPQLAATLIAISGMLLRAAIVPSRSLRTAAISAGMALPALWVASRGTGIGSTSLDLSYAAFWLSVGVWLSAAVSEAIYRLRAVARYALALGQYKLRQHIGSGGMGEVYVAEHAALRRPTAVKLIRPDRVTKAYVTRFEREAQLMARLTHPNTVTVYDYGRTSGGVFYIAMEYLQGIDLERLVERWGPQHPGRVVRIMAQTCGSLGEAHASGLVHRDLKPANLMLLPKHGQRELIKVLDFGLAKTMLEDGLELSAAGSLVGTPQYIAPECLRGEKLDGRTDLYMLGAIAYFLLTGQTPFERKTLAETCAAHLNDPVIPPSQVRGEPIPAALEALVLSCLAKQRDERPASAEALHQALVAADVPEFTAEDEAKFWEEAKDILAQPESQKNREPLTVSQLWGRGA